MSLIKFFISVFELYLLEEVMISPLMIAEKSSSSRCRATLLSLPIKKALADVIAGSKLGNRSLSVAVSVAWCTLLSTAATILSTWRSTLSDKLLFFVCKRLCKKITDTKNFMIPEKKNIFTCSIYFFLCFRYFFDKIVSVFVYLTEKPKVLLFYLARRNNYSSNTENVLKKNQKIFQQQCERKWSLNKQFQVWRVILNDLFFWNQSNGVLVFCKNEQWYFHRLTSFSSANQIWSFFDVWLEL